MLTLSIKSAGSSHLLPNLDEGVVSVSFVWPSNDGLTIIALTKTIRFSLTWAVLTVTFFFFLMVSHTCLAIWLAM